MPPHFEREEKPRMPEKTTDSNMLPHSDSKGQEDKSLAEYPYYMPIVRGKGRLAIWPKTSLGPRDWVLSG